MGDRHFNQLQDWGAQKHRILSHYLTPWARKLGSRWPELAFVDLCAGAGRYYDGPAGSPLLAAQVNDELGKRGKRLVVHACEAASGNYSRLREALKVYLEAAPPLAHVYGVRFQDVLLRILGETRGQPTLIFLDPYGVRDLTKSDLTPILNDAGRAPTELLVRVPPRALARMAGWLVDRERKASAQKTAEGVRTLLKNLDISQELLLEAAAADDFHAGPDADVLFRSYLRKFRGRFAYVRGIPIRPRFGAAPKYFLVHCTDHPDGVLIMNDVASVAEDRLFVEQEKVRDKEQLPLLQPERAPKVSLSEAAKDLTQRLTRGKQYPYKELRLALVEMYGPEFREKQHRRIVDLMLKQGLQRVESNAHGGHVYVIKAPLPFLRETGPTFRRRAGGPPPSESGRLPA